MRTVKILLLVVSLIFSTALWDAQAKGGGAKGRGGGRMFSGGSGNVYGGNGYYGNGNQQKNADGQKLRLRDGSCINPQGMGQSQGSQRLGTDRNAPQRNKNR